MLWHVLQEHTTQVLCRVLLLPAKVALGVNIQVQGQHHVLHGLYAIVVNIGQELHHFHQETAFHAILAMLALETKLRILAHLERILCGLDQPFVIRALLAASRNQQQVLLHLTMHVLCAQ